jgi:hypothetical protein
MSKNTKDLKCKWLIACSSATIDGDSNLLSISNMVEEITIQVAPEQIKDLSNNKISNIATPMDVIVLWERMDGVQGAINKKFKLKFVNDDNDTLLSADDGVVKMEPFHNRFRARFKLPGVSCKGPGLYKFQVLDENDKEVLCEEKIQIKFVDQNNKPIEIP